MNLKAKEYVQEDKTAAREKLTAREAMLGEKGLEKKAIGRDPIVRKLQADIRKANRRLKAIADQEALIEDKAKAKAKKAEAKKKAQAEGKSAKKSAGKKTDKAAKAEEGGKKKQKKDKAAKKK